MIDTTDFSPVIKSSRLGEILLADGHLTKEQLDISLQQQKQMQSLGRSVRLGELLVRNRFCTPELLNAALHSKGKSVTEIQEDVPFLSPSICARYAVIPVELEGTTLVIKSSKSLTSKQREEILFNANVPAEAIRTVLVDRHEMHRVLSKQMAHDSFTVLLDRLRISDKNPAMMRNVIDALFHEAIDRRASDIHLDLKADPDAWVSLRIDSRLRQSHLLSEQLMAPIFSRIKTLCGMDASNSRTAMDGRMQIDHRGRIVNFRIATQPLVDGETMTIRIVDAATLPTVEALFPHQPRMMQFFNKIAKIEGKTGGLVLVTGATGSGKSTTLYTAAGRFQRDRVNVLTVEDPVEFILPFARQIQLHQLLDQKATQVERSVLRQDPDVLIFGEIRDADSARTALKFAESGHFVMATLHAKTAAQSLERLLSMLSSDDRTEAAFVLCATLLGVVNQVLFPRLCACAEPMSAQEIAQPDGEAAEFGTYLGHSGLTLPTRLMRAVGCPRCESTGYRSRLAVHETLMLEVSDEDRAHASREVSDGATMSSLLDLPGVHHITRRDVALDLLTAGLIDLPTAIGATGARLQASHSSTLMREMIASSMAEIAPPLVIIEGDEYVPA